LRREHDSLESTRADLVDGRRIRIDRQACTQGNLSCRGLADASLHDVAKVDLLYGCGFNFGLLKGVLEGDDAEFGCGKGLEGTIEGADRSASSGDNDNFVWTVIRLKYGSLGNCDEGRSVDERTIERVVKGIRREEKAGRVIEDRRERSIVFGDLFMCNSHQAEMRPSRI
jgi:hypothetical protein